MGKTPLRRTLLAAPRKGAALAFVAGNGSAVTGSDAGLPSGAAPRTLVASAKCTLAASDIFTYGTGSAEHGQGFGFSGSGANLLYFGWSDDMTVATGIAANTWARIVCTFDGTTATVYVNGLAVGSSARAAWSTILGGSYHVGRNINASNFLTGLVDDVRVYNVCLDAAGVLNLHNGANPPQTPLLWLRFDEGYGTVATDAGSLGNTGALTACAYSRDVPPWAGRGT